MGKQRIIKFNLGDLSKSDLKNIGVYKIINTINGHFYIGSTDRKFSERFKEHCRYYEQYKEGTKRNIHPILWCAYDKYGIENFKVEILECMNNKSFYDILDREEYYIEQLNPEYNICKHPTCGGKPNLGRKLSKEWKQKIGKNSRHKHSKEVLNIITNNNKNNAVKLQFLKDSETLTFNSWVDAARYFNTTPSALQSSYKRKRKYKDWNINKLSLQKKSIKIKTPGLELTFNSYGECDRYFNMWKGYTSELVNKSSKNKFLDKYEYELI